jgi:hypothetical protein
MNRNLLLLPAILAILLLSTNLAAAQPGIAAEAVLTPPAQELTVGDPIALSLTVTHSAGDEVILPDLPDTWGDFVVRSQSVPTEVDNGDGSVTTTQTIEVSLFNPGTFTTPPLSLTIADPAGQLSQVKALPASVNIASVLVEGDSNLRDIKPQAELPYFDPAPWLAAAAVVGLTAGIVYWVRRVRQAKQAMATQDSRLPHEIALDELDRIAGLRLPESGQLKEHYTLTSDCLRSYVEQAYAIPVTDQTTDEIQHHLRSSPVDEEIAQALVSFLSDCDLVKFAKYRPNVADAYALLTRAGQIVRQSSTTLGDPMRRLDGQLSVVTFTGPERFSVNGYHQSKEIGA